MSYTRRALLAGGAATLSGCLGATGSPCPAPVEAGNLRLGFGGDAMLARGVTDRWTGRDPAGVWDGLVGRLRSLDGFVCNLECCVSERGERRPDKTYSFRADPDVALPALSVAGTAAVSLANNHVLDFGRPALVDTLDGLSSVGIAHAGAGLDLSGALAPAVFEAGGATVAVVALTDQWPTYRAGTDSPGTAYAALDPTDPGTRSLVRSALDAAAERDPDLLVASLHWGPNWVVAPDGTQQRFARWLIDAGVDVVHGHSAHVLQGIEVYCGRPILYDTGDIVDDYVIKEGLHNDRSALFELHLDGGLTGLQVVPVEIADEAVGPAEGAVAQWVRDRVRALSAAFGTVFERRDKGLWLPLG